MIEEYTSFVNRSWFKIEYVVKDIYNTRIELIWKLFNVSPATDRSIVIPILSLLIYLRVDYVAFYRWYVFVLLIIIFVKQIEQIGFRLLILIFWFSVIIMVVNCLHCKIWCVASFY